MEDWKVEPIGWATLVEAAARDPARGDDGPLRSRTGWSKTHRSRSTSGSVCGSGSGDTALAFHNANFDLPFLQQFFSDAGRRRPEPVIPTRSASRAGSAAGETTRSKLCERLGVKRRTAHRALGDAMMTANVTTLMARCYEIPAQGIRSPNSPALSPGHRCTVAGASPMSGGESAPLRDKRRVVAGRSARQSDRYFPQGWCFTLIPSRRSARAGTPPWILEHRRREDTIPAAARMARTDGRGAERIEGTKIITAGGGPGPHRRQHGVAHGAAHDRVRGACPSVMGDR